MRASKTILSILHRDFDKLKQGGRVMVLDEKAAEKLPSQILNAFKMHSERIFNNSFSRLLVPTPFTKGEGSSRPHQLSQKPLHP